MTIRAATRAAAVTLLEGYKAANDSAIKQIYAGRPSSFYLPCAFVDSINESEITYTASMVQRTPRAEIRLVHGTFDSAEAVAQQDALVDGFISYVVANKHAAGGRTLVAIVSVSDEPGWVPEWLPLDQQRSYYSTVVVLEGLALTAD